jgi:hypothetical protein
MNSNFMKESDVCVTTSLWVKTALRKNVQIIVLISKQFLNKSGECLLGLCRCRPGFRGISCE